MIHGGVIHGGVDTWLGHGSDSTDSGHDGMELGGVTNWKRIEIAF